jgi:transcriptional regulator with XRE-family HTH domain
MIFWLRFKILEKKEVSALSLVQRNLIRIIDEKALVKKGVARRAGMSEQAFSSILSGRKVIRADMIPSLAAAVDVQIPELFKELEKGG